MTKDILMFRDLKMTLTCIVIFIDIVEGEKMIIFVYLRPLIFVLSKTAIPSDIKLVHSSNRILKYSKIKDK